MAQTPMSLPYRLLAARHPFLKSITHREMSTLRKTPTFSKAEMERIIMCVSTWNFKPQLNLEFQLGPSEVTKSNDLVMGHHGKYRSKV